MDRRHGFGTVDRGFYEPVMFPSRLAGGKWKRFVFHGSPVRLVTTLHTNIYLCPRRVDRPSRCAGCAGGNLPCFTSGRRPLWQRFEPNTTSTSDSSPTTTKR